MTDAKRQQLKNKVAAGKARHRDLGRTTIVDRAGEAAIEAKDKFAAFAREHPIATVAGGLALGVLVSSLFKRSPTRKLGGRAAGMAAAGAELALAFAQQALATASEAGRDGADKLGDLGSTARDLGRDAAGKAGELGESARAAARDAGHRLGKALRHRVN